MVCAPDARRPRRERASRSSAGRSRNAGGHINQLRPSRPRIAEPPGSAGFPRASRKARIGFVEMVNRARGRQLRAIFQDDSVLNRKSETELSAPPFQYGGIAALDHNRSRRRENFQVGLISIDPSETCRQGPDDQRAEHRNEHNASRNKPRGSSRILRRGRQRHGARLPRSHHRSPRRRHRPSKNRRSHAQRRNYKTRAAEAQRPGHHARRRSGDLSAHRLPARTRRLHAHHVA